MSWENIIKAKWVKRGNEYGRLADRDKPYEERTTGEPYEGILNEQIINDMAKDLNLPRGNYDLEAEDAIFVKLVSKTIDKYPNSPPSQHPSDIFYRTRIDLDLEIEINNLEVREMNTGTIIHTFKEENIVITHDIEIELGENSFDFEVVDYHNGKLYVEIVKV